MNWIQLELVCAASRVNDFKAILDDYGHGGCVVEELPEEEGLTGSLSCLRAYLPVSRKYRAVQTEIVEKLRKAGYQGGLKEQRLKQNEWFASLKQDFKESDVGDRFIIRPSWSRKKSVPPGRTLLKIDPGAAFGTGLHPTTRLCLQELEKHIKRSYTVFDLGTGTGILAIAAAKLGAGAIYACDIDAVAVKTAAANAVMNSVTGITFKRGHWGLPSYVAIKTVTILSWPTSRPGQSAF
jgi:ribosomal protein L11 methyltransferase